MVAKIICNDYVIILSGKNKNRCGVVKKILDNQKILIKGINIVKKYPRKFFKKSKDSNSFYKAIPIHISNVRIFDKVARNALRVSFDFVNKKKIRIFRNTKKFLPIV